MSYYSKFCDFTFLGKRYGLSYFVVLGVNRLTMANYINIHAATLPWGFTSFSSTFLLHLAPLLLFKEVAG